MKQAKNPIIKEVWPPFKTLANISRPNLSVPNKCSNEGACRIFVGSSWYGEIVYTKGSKKIAKITAINKYKATLNIFYTSILVYKNNKKVRFYQNS